MYQETLIPHRTGELARTLESADVSTSADAPFQKIHALSSRHRKPMDEDLCMSHYEMERHNEEGKQTYAHLSSLYQLSIKLNQTLDMDQVMENALHGLMTMVHAQTGFLVLVDREMMPIHWITSDMPIALSEPAIVSALQSGMAGRVLRRQKPLLLGDTQRISEPICLPGRSVLFVPFQCGTTMTGMVVLAHEQPNSFDVQHEQEAHHAVVEVVVPSLRNAWRYTELHHEETIRAHMIGMLVHDIRSPLMSTHASFEIIQRILHEFSIEPEIQRFVQESLDSGKRSLQAVLDLTSDLLDMKKLQSGRRPLDYQSISVEMLFEDIYRLLYNLSIQSQVMIRYQVTPRALKLLGDERLLRRVLVNLAANGLRFSPRGGTLTFKAYQTTDQSGVILAVEDMGPGVEPGERKRIFQPFVQASGESHRGTGLGLALCREVALAHGGRIWVEDREGGGSRFCVLIPNVCTM